MNYVHIDNYVMQLDRNGRTICTTTGQDAEQWAERIARLLTEDARRESEQVTELVTAEVDHA